MTLDLAIGEYVRQLRRAGTRPGEHLVKHILAGGEAAAGPLIALAADTRLLFEEPPVAYAPLHALRLLGELSSPRMIEPLLDRLPINDDAESDTVDLWVQDVPQILARLGSDGVSALWAYADDPQRHPIGRATALLALAFATAIDEHLREPIVAGLRERLARSDDRELNAHLVRALGLLCAGDAYGEIMARYRAGDVDQEIVSAATARQLLLGKEHSVLACARHPLWERYDEHGPSDNDTDKEW